MDFHLIPSSPQEHLEMMEKMLQLNKFPHIMSRPYQEISESSDLEFSSGSATSNETPPNIFQNPYLSTSNSSMFMGYNFIQDSGHGNTPSNVMTSNFGNAHELSFSNNSLQKRNSIEAMREMIFRVAMMQPILIDPESVKPPKRKNVKISKDPQSVAARHRRERIGEKIRILQRLVPGGTKMDTASMLDEAVHYVKFLKKQVDTLQKGASNGVMVDGLIGFQPGMSSTAMNTYPGLVKNCQNFNIMASNASMQMLS